MTPALESNFFCIVVALPIAQTYAHIALNELKPQVPILQRPPGRRSHHMEGLGSTDQDQPNKQNLHTARSVRVRAVHTPTGRRPCPTVARAMASPGWPASAARPGVAVDRGQPRRRRPLLPPSRAVTNIPNLPRPHRVGHPVPSVQCNASHRAVMMDRARTQLLLVDATARGAR